jgi:hypothetical protein
MGILDDAIREHLELIRSHGATDSEVQRLEDEAFGPPTRPDEADFPESEEAPSGNGMAADVAEPSPEEAAMHEDVTTLLPSEGQGPATEEPDEPEAEGAAPAAEEPELGAEDAVAEPDVVDEEPAHEEPAAEVHPVVEQPEPQEAEDAAEASDAPSPEGTTFYDQESGEEVAFDDLDLTLDEPPAADEPPADVAEAPEAPEATEGEGVRPLEPPIESLDTVEHPFPEEIVEGEEPHEDASPSDEHTVPEDPEPSGDAAGEGEAREGEEDEDVLADTPEFLKDRPEDDELWFEQREPKDFDF